MNQRPQQPQHRGEPQRAPQRSSAGPQQGGPRPGNFQVNIDQRDLMTGPIEQPRGRRQPDLYSEPPSMKKAQLTDKELRAEKRAHKKRNRVKARKNKRIFKIMWLCMVLLISFTFASYLIGGSNDFLGAGRPEGKADVTIPEGELTEDQLAEILHQAGIISKPEFFSLYCKIKEHRQLQPGHQASGGHQYGL